MASVTWMIQTALPNLLVPGMYTYCILKGVNEQWLEARAFKIMALRVGKAYKPK